MKKKKIQFNFWNQIRWENASLGPTGDHIFFNEFGKTHHVTQHLGDKYRDEIRRERRHASAHVRRPQLHFFWRRRLGSYLWAEGAVRCHPQNSDGGVAIEVLSVSVWVYPSVLVPFGIYEVAVVTAVMLCVTHSESVPARAISEEEHDGSCW